MEVCPGTFGLSWHFLTINRKVKVRIRIWFICQCEMPPFGVYRFKTMSYHSIAEYHAVDILFVCYSFIIRTGERTEIIVCTTHIHFFFSFHIKECKIDSAATAVPGVIGYISLAEEDGFIDFRVEVFLHSRIIRIRCPINEMCYCSLWPVCIIYL